jgi:hypothetical protein
MVYLGDNKILECGEAYNRRMTYSERVHRVFDTLGHNGFHGPASAMREQMKRDEKREPQKVEERSTRLYADLAAALAQPPEEAPKKEPKEAA